MLTALRQNCEVH